LPNPTLLRIQRGASTFLPRGRLKPDYLFDFDFCTRSFDLFLDLVTLLLRHTFLDRFGRSFYERLRFRQTKPRDCAADLLDHSDLVCAHFCEDHVKRGLLLSRWSCCSARCAR